VWNLKSTHNHLTFQNHLYIKVNAMTCLTLFCLMRIKVILQGIHF
jgi:hypothetical protein